MSEISKTCPDCDKELHSTNAMKSHYVNAHGRPWPWKNDSIYSNEFQKKRESVRERDNYRCQNCNVHQSDMDHQRALHVHHIDDEKDEGLHDMDNLVSLCPKCHRNVTVGNIELN